MSENPLAKLGELSRPATVLIEKISDAVGGLFKPWQTVRVAKAEAEANRIRAEAQIQVTDLHKRAFHRFLEEEAKRQSNMEDIARKALPHLHEDSSPQDMDSDWIANFFDKCRIVSGEDMKQLWARILAGEANGPGKFSRRTVNLVADLDKSDANLFQRLCGFAWWLGDFVPLVYDVQHEIYNSHEINFNTLSHLESLGLIQFHNITGFKCLKIPKKPTTFYYGRRLELTFPRDSDNELDIGRVLLTRAGQELAPVCGSTPVDGFFEFVYERWAEQSLVPKKNSEQAAIGES